MSDLSTRRIRIWNSLSFNRGRFPVCLGERLNGIQEVSGSIPLISTKGKDREPKGSLSFSFAKKFCAGANRRRCCGGLPSGRAATDIECEGLRSKRTKRSFDFAFPSKET